MKHHGQITSDTMTMVSVVVPRAVIEPGKEVSPGEHDSSVQIRMGSVIVILLLSVYRVQTPMAGEPIRGWFSTWRQIAGRSAAA